MNYAKNIENRQDYPTQIKQKPKLKSPPWYLFSYEYFFYQKITRIVKKKRKKDDYLQFCTKMAVHSFLPQSMYSWEWVGGNHLLVGQNILSYKQLLDVIHNIICFISSATLYILLYHLPWLNNLPSSIIYIKYYTSLYIGSLPSK